MAVTVRSESELFELFRHSLPPEAQRDIGHYIYLYDMFLDETDPKTIELLRSEMHRLERKYNLTLDHSNTQKKPPSESGQ